MGSTEPINKSQKRTANKPAAGAPFYTPAQEPAIGTTLQPSTAAAAAAAAALPTLFTPLRIRGLELPNRFVVSPMCTYSADDGHLTDFHLVHLGQFALRGPGLTIVEATAVTPNGRISPEDSGLWADSQIAPLRRVVDFAHSQGHKIGIQLAHAGRKASTLAPWLVKEPQQDSHLADEAAGGWPHNVWGPSPVAWSDAFPQPREMTVDEIKSLVQSWVDAAKRAVRAGVDVIEIHGAHGYLITSFLSPLSNKRTDQYGGSFENRTRLLKEVITAVRAVIPETMPLFVRISATEWMEWDGQPSWDMAASLELAAQLPALGVDLLDVSSGGNSAGQRISVHPYFQANFAGRIRDALHAASERRMLVGAVGMITSAEMARAIVQARGEEVVAEGDPVELEDEQGASGLADVVLIARQFLREPEFVLRTAHQLGVDLKWPAQYHRAEWRKGTKL